MLKIPGVRFANKTVLLKTLNIKKMEVRQHYWESEIVLH